MKIQSCIYGTVIGITAFCLCSRAAAALPAQGNSLTLTVYSSGRAQVQSTHTITASAGLQQIRFNGFPAKTDPSSIRLIPAADSPDFSVSRMSFSWDLARRDILLKRHVSLPIIISTRENGTVSGTLLNVTPEELFVRESEGTLRIVPAASVTAYELPRQKDDLTLTPTLDVGILGSREGPQKAGLSYLTEGLSWQAFYNAVVDKEEQTMHFSGTAAVENNTGAAYNDARLILIAGDIHLQKNLQPFPRRAGRHMSVRQSDSSSVREQPVFEYHQYTLKHPVTLPAYRTMHLSLFPASACTIEKKYIYEPKVSEKQVRVEYQLKNSPDSGPGRPIPGGKVRLYIANKTDSFQFIGEDSFSHTPVNSTITLKAGSAFDVSASRSVASRHKINHRSRRETVEIRLHNRKKQDINIEIIEHFQEAFEITKTSHTAQHTDASKAVFNISVPGQRETLLRYTVLLKW